MRQDIFFCSALSRLADEQAIGTASGGDVWLLLEYRKAWGARAFQESHLPKIVKRHLSNALKSVPRSRLLFIKQERRNASIPLTLFSVNCREGKEAIVRFQLASHEQLLEIDLAAVAAGKASGGGERWAEPLFLVCTHGRRDKCCAKFGYPLYKSLSATEGVWQSSHVGGDRFAANLVCFPHGLFYAHVTEEAGRKIVDEYRQQRLFLENYRGRAAYSSPIQAAEYFVRTESGMSGIGDLRFFDYQPIRDRNWRVRFVSLPDGKLHEADLQSRLSEFHNPLTCHSEEEKRVVQYSLNSYKAESQKTEVRRQESE